MKVRFAQKALAAAAVVGMLATPLAAFATTQASSASSSSASVEATVAAAVTDSGSGTTSTPAPAVTAIPANGKVSANGATLYATAAGVSTVKSVAAVAVTAPEADLSAALGLGKGEKAFTSSYDISAKTAPASSAAIADAAASQNATVLGQFNLIIGKISGGKFVAADGSVRVKTSIIIPANADPSKTYAVVVVSKGGAVRIEQDQNVDNGKIVTFNADGGLAAYALISLN